MKGCIFKMYPLRLFYSRVARCPIRGKLAYKKSSEKVCKVRFIAYFCISNIGKSPKQALFEWACKGHKP
ncbi:MAG: hypothetical protein EAZ95_07250 [Bacteroidetes bacterium]|nr:MAG: hypothetical protein EAZ95_07250 [Bacteroidota bacterium]